LLWLPNLGAQGPNSPRAIVEGDITNAVTGAPIAGARVKIAKPGCEPLYTRAGRSGHFRFDNVPPAAYFLNVRLNHPADRKKHDHDFPLHEPGNYHVYVPDEQGNLVDGANPPLTLRMPASPSQ
jgi:hypothetical protein